ncbi:MAG: aldo/keto reductase [Thomasclavelia sp.]
MLNIHQNKILIRNLKTNYKKSGDNLWKYITLNNGIKMPMVGLGTWKLRGNSGKDSIIEALQIGYRLIDTAQMYGNEEIVGEAIKESKINREDIFITTKLDQSSAGYQEAKKGIERSLKALQTDYIDLLLIHEPYQEALAMYDNERSLSVEKSKSYWYF